MKDEDINKINTAIDAAFDHEAAREDAKEIHVPWFKLEKDWRPGPNLRTNSIW